MREKIKLYLTVVSAPLLYVPCCTGISKKRVILLPGLFYGRPMWTCLLHPAVMTGGAERDGDDVRMSETAAVVVKFSSASAKLPLESAL